MKSSRRASSISAWAARKVTLRPSTNLTATTNSRSAPATTTASARPSSTPTREPRMSCSPWFEPSPAKKKPARTTSPRTRARLTRSARRLLGSRARITSSRSALPSKPGEEKASKDDVAKNQGAVDKIREAAARQQSQNNLKQIGLAFHNFHDSTKAMPAHAIYSKDGKTPLLSWRVSILPYIEEGELYKQFKLDEAWDSEHNKKLIAKMPKIYVLPLGKAKDGETYYQVVTGKDTVFDGPKGMKFQAITDGTSNTMLALEAKDPVVWTKPADLTFPKDKDKKVPTGAVFSNGFNLLFCDGSVRFMSNTVSAETMRAIITPSGGEVIQD